MTFKILLLEAAEKDIEGAIGWYEKQQDGLGSAFFSEVERSLEFISEMPEASPKKLYGLRVKLVHRFPYALFYKVLDIQRVEIYACLHLR